jgi:hypothetical protein
MPFYIRKALRVGPVRFNLSKSGLGMSVGVRGFRLGTGPRGNYIHMGEGGSTFGKLFHHSHRFHATRPRPGQNQSPSVPTRQLGRWSKSTAAAFCR